MKSHDQRPKFEEQDNRVKVRALYEKIAGDKLTMCDDAAGRFMERGYKPERAWAEALDVFKLVKNDKVED